MLACETMQLYEGDRDGFARLVEVMEPVDIRPNDRRAAVLPPVMGQPLAPPTNSPRMPSALPEPNIPAPGSPPPPPKALPLPSDTPEPGSFSNPPISTPAPPAPPSEAPVSPPKAAPQTPAATLPPRSEPMPAAARLAKKPIVKQPAKLSLEDPQAANPEPLNANKAKTSLQREPTFQPPPTKPRTKLPAVPAPPMPRADVPAAVPTPPPPAPTLDSVNALPQAVAPKPQRQNTIASPDSRSPSARDQGRPLIQRTQSVSQASAFAAAGNPLLGTQIGGAIRPVGARTPQITRQVVASAKGALAECYVNEQLFQDDAKGTVIVVIEVPKELPNRPRIETSDFSETMSACLLDAVRNLAFPGDPEGAAYRLRIPFRFRPD